ncbi:hypothetical protein COO60DRAFT_762515 [Scenedesmus sp. NREL 46B-D3]|nr:hypothetical protein COO60DRAFT_762515 [Scenedesmus sp. NREL 46B-D3]
MEPCALPLQRVLLLVTSSAAPWSPWCLNGMLQCILPLLCKPILCEVQPQKASVDQLAQGRQVLAQLGSTSWCVSSQGFAQVEPCNLQALNTHACQGQVGALPDRQPYTTSLLPCRCTRGNTRQHSMQKCCCQHKTATSVLLLTAVLMHRTVQHNKNMMHCHGD